METRFQCLQILMDFMKPHIMAFSNPACHISTMSYWLTIVNLSVATRFVRFLCCNTTSNLHVAGHGYWSSSNGLW